ncbi:hypothetical protein FYK55_18890 [Roseiconus nitratireducens]|uniref:Uncharacterized protein n=1 Tax=Roseiconus nitratireducens TaxID=2605748 RepID=A0A5M6D3X3_9BACT|nr:hypothetical protein [Roseiconus nitratireducens]KAA5540972.1 hypothetical protein FYK55_18890 [Roseiconus nitratireducens]
MAARARDPARRMPPGGWAWDRWDRFSLHWNDSDDVGNDPWSVFIMAILNLHWRSTTFAFLMITACGWSGPSAMAETPRIQFDLPSVAPAFESTCGNGGREVSFDLVLSSLVVDLREGSPRERPPIDHLLVRCRLRDRLPIVDFAPRTELQSDFASPIAISNKQEKNKAFQMGIDAVYPPLGGGHLGADEKKTHSDSTQFERQPPMQAVVASGTTDRGRGVYFKLRWTSQQVLEGQKHFRLTVAVPPSWRGGLVDVSVVAHGREQPLFGAAKLKPIAGADFVVALHQEHDAEAAAIAVKLAQLDRTLAEYARGRAGSNSNAFAQFFQRVLMPEDQAGLGKNWYRRITHDQADPYLDEQIRSLPMPVRVAVLDYDQASRELQQLNQAESS